MVNLRESTIREVHRKRLRTQVFKRIYRKLSEENFENYFEKMKNNTRLKIAYCPLHQFLKSHWYLKF